MIWHNPAKNPPTHLTDVLLAVRGEERASEGWRNPDGNYTFASGHPVDAADVLAWTELPLVPASLAQEGWAA